MKKLNWEEFIILVRGVPHSSYEDVTDIESTGLTIEDFKQYGEHHHFELVIFAAIEMDVYILAEYSLVSPKMGTDRVIKRATAAAEE